MHKRTTIGFQMVELDDHTVTLYDNEWYGEVHLNFESLEQAEQCYKDTLALLEETHTKLGEMGWKQAEGWEHLYREEVS